MSTIVFEIIGIENLAISKRLIQGAVEYSISHLKMADVAPTVGLLPHLLGSRGRCSGACIQFDRAQKPRLHMNSVTLHICIRLQMQGAPAETKVAIAHVPRSVLASLYLPWVQKLVASDLLLGYMARLCGIPLREDTCLHPRHANSGLPSLTCSRHQLLRKRNPTPSDRTSTFISPQPSQASRN